MEPGEPVALSNGLVSVEVDEAMGTFALDGRAGYGRLVDGGTSVTPTTTPRRARTRSSTHPSRYPSG